MAFQGQEVKLAPKVEANKFEDFEQARAVFDQNGVCVDREAELDLLTLSAMPYLAKRMQGQMPSEGDKPGKKHANWR